MECPISEFLSENSRNLNRVKDLLFANHQIFIKVFPVQPVQDFPLRRRSKPSISSYFEESVRKSARDNPERYCRWF